MADVTKSVANMSLSPCSVKFDGDSLGYTSGGCSLTIDLDWVEITHDDGGSTVADLSLKGYNAEIKCILGQNQVDLLAKILPTGTASGSNSVLLSGADVGDRAQTYAKELVLHPTENAVGDRSNDVVMYKAIPFSIDEITFNREDTTKYTVTFKGLMDESNANRLLLLGNSAA